MKLESGRSLPVLEWILGDRMYDFVDDNPQPADKPTAEPETKDAISESQTGACEDPAIEKRHTGEFSMALHGLSHPDALYRAAGGESDVLNAVRFGCPCCGRSVGRVIRVRATKKTAWQAVCAMCAASTLAKNPEALVGGLVRAGRRRRRKQNPMRDAG